MDLRCLPWFDRVASASNPVDGLSRGEVAGPWSFVQRASAPKGLLMAITAELAARDVRSN